ncbi:MULTISPECIES: sensor histidine kinase [unclassified Lactobacillus]|uniref:sensor histidine kinase n=1 Tax=unclassified Lactobacillus TaxID=2620435 RepID=UPI0018DD371F|nr:MULTISPECIES: HAMP domain-containing sensor histidine kinase [unclassified Lactobacillus]MBH9989048.1 HAMP domain-containing histidine kinase [Lactobacillus sp. M0392]MBI0023659.1 HAMP domain-containing histidine kinase [Lactobacillus sp. W8171]MBI0044089.1 HAMP domain-containing histidine kinase [Lactobacillus sp. M0393]
MKLIYQHMLSFLLIIITTVSIIGFSEINNTTQQSYEYNYRRMEDFAAALGTLATNDKKDGAAMLNPKFLNKLEFVLHSDRVYLSVFNAQGSQVYPQKNDKIKLTPHRLRQLKSGKKLRIKNNNEALSSLGYKKDACTGVLLPWKDKGKFIGAMWLGVRIAQVERPVRIAKQNLFNALVSAMIVGLVLSLILSFYATNRIKKLSVATKKVTAGDFDVQTHYCGHDEITQLADNFNQMVRTLKKSNQEVKEQEKRRDQFMADAAHEMRTPLTTINGILEGLQYDAIPDKAKPKSIALMSRETKRLIRLVNENLDYEKIRNNQINLVKTRFNARKTFDDVTMQLKQNAAKADDTIFITAPKNLPVYADKDRFTQIMVNLVQNAIQFTANGKIEISGYRIAHATVIMIKDNGIGMNQQQIKYAFERYFKADPSRSRSGKGEYGLGLSIVSSLIKQHGGKISVQSAINQGAEFTIILFDQGYEQYLED